ncbi:MAG: hypothetical protein LBR44_08495 [Clostridiales Family XIII bacterium]|jgi:hypothetical protein|nr:hypothetical protein [Clostridiales Family XIII bacterium]
MDTSLVWMIWIMVVVLATIVAGYIGYFKKGKTDAEYDKPPARKDS